VQPVAEYMGLMERAGALPVVRVIEGASSEPMIRIGGRSVVSFCSSNYLGLSTHPEVKQAVIDTVVEYGLGANGSRLISGTTDLHIALEEATARFKGCAAAIAFPTGFMVNTGTIAALAYLPFFARMTGQPLASRVPDLVVLSDALNHASIIEGLDAARCKHANYAHRDLDDLERKLHEHPGKRLLIVTDGIFSMDGDMAPLPGIVELASEYGAEVLLDDAHATGVLGRTGRGTLEHFDLERTPNILQMGTYSKSYGGLGGFLAADAETVDYLRIAARPYMFSGAMPACVAAGVLKAMEIAAREPQRRVRVLRNRDYVADGIERLGFETLGVGTPIVPIVIGDDTLAMEMSDELFARDILAPCIRWPAVARGESRIRLTLMASHEREHLDRLLEAFEEVGRSHGLV